MHIITPKEIIFGEEKKTLTWTTFTDEVVGGLSKGKLLRHEDFLEFSGSLFPSIDKGWAGMRSVHELHDLSSYKFIEIKIKTDGKPYHFQMEYDPSWQNDKLSTIIDIVSNQWKVMHIEMEAFQIYNTKTGFLNRKPKLEENLKMIHRYNILSSSKNVSDFNFQIEYIKFH